MSEKRGIKREETTIVSNFDGLSLGVSVRVPERPVGILQLIHGMAEHRERYHDFMDYCAEHGLVVVLHDHRGHGESAGSEENFGYFGKNGIEALIQDVHQVTEYIKSRFPGLPLTLFGHSMGSLIVCCYIQEYDWDINGLIVCGSPSKRVGAGMGVIVARIMAAFRGERHRSKFVNKLAFGEYNKRFSDAKSSNSWIVSDQAVVEAYDADTRDGFVFTLNGFETLFGLIKRTYRKSGWAMQNPGMPVRFIAGADDPCIISEKDFWKAVNFLRKQGYRDVEGKLYPGMRHEILNEVDKEEVWRDVLNYVSLARHDERGDKVSNNTTAGANGKK